MPFVMFIVFFALNEAAAFLFFRRKSGYFHPHIEKISVIGAFSDIVFYNIIVFTGLMVFLLGAVSETAFGEYICLAVPFILSAVFKTYIFYKIDRRGVSEKEKKKISFSAAAVTGLSAYAAIAAIPLIDRVLSQLLNRFLNSGLS